MPNLKPLEIVARGVDVVVLWTTAVVKIVEVGAVLVVEVTVEVVAESVMVMMLASGALR